MMIGPIRANAEDRDIAFDEQLSQAQLCAEQY